MTTCKGIGQDDQATSCFLRKVGTQEHMQESKNLYPFECILLSGMPCTGKDTLSQKLIERDASFMLLKKHRAVATPQTRASDATYFDISPEEFQAMAHSGEFLQYHSRYGKMYGVSRAAYQIE